MNDNGSAANVEKARDVMPEIFDLMGEHEHEQVVFFYEPSSGYRGIIAIHDTSLGPALGGTRY